MKKWEYMEVKNESANIKVSLAGLLGAEQLNTYGKEGWELVTIVGYQYIFKREII